MGYQKVYQNKKQVGSFRRVKRFGREAFETFVRVGGVLNFERITYANSPAEARETILAYAAAQDRNY